MTTTNNKKIVHEYKCATIVDRVELNKLNSEKLASVMSEVFSTGKQVLIIENVQTFFSKKNVLTSLTENQEQLPVLLEHYEIEMAPDDTKTLSRFVELRKELKTKLESVVPAYNFMPVPEGWDFEREIAVNASNGRVERRGTNYYIGKATLERIWRKAAPLWQNREPDYTSSATLFVMNTISAAGYNREPRIYSNRVEVGCQAIQRYELEQFAAHFNWAFPE